MRVTKVGAGLVGCCLLALGGLGGAVTASRTLDGAPPQVAPAGDLVVPVTTADFDDSRTVQLTAEVDERDPLRSNVSGTVTAAECVLGEALKSGAVIGAVDARPVRLLSTSAPLWRDLRTGDTGADVSAVQGELTRLGFDITDTGRVDTATASAVRDWLTGGDDELWRAYQGGDFGLVLPLAAVVWSPQRSVTPVRCGIRLGTNVDAGTEVLTPAPEVSSISLASPAASLPGQPRVLTLGSVTVAVDGNGSVADPDDVAALAGTPEFAAWLASDAEDRRLEGTLALDAPIMVAAVPPAAVVGLGTDQVCLRDPDGATTPVVVVSSRLGQSLVTVVDPDATLPARVVIDRTGSSRCVSP